LPRDPANGKKIVNMPSFRRFGCSGFLWPDTCLASCPGRVGASRARALRERARALREQGKSTRAGASRACASRARGQARAGAGMREQARAGELPPEFLLAIEIIQRDLGARKAFEGLFRPLVGLRG
jgi:hypothetical protein